MPFNSLKFLYFFSAISTIYYLLPYRYRWALLLAASGYFYASFSEGYLLLILILVIINYLSALAIEKASIHRKLILVVSILSQIGILCVFKYGGLLVKALGSVGGQYQNWVDHLILPLGLSYITLQSIGYMVDVYNKRQPAERNIGVLALFFLFFPKIMAGPIERPINLIPQFRKNYDFDYVTVTNGLKVMTWGFFKKIIIADNLALIANPVFNHPHDYSGISLLVATIAFTFQIYFDFSGYSDIALGLARVMGINLINNFRNPYFASSISEFWQRWHISLSSWLRDYVFFPLRRYLSRNRKNQTLSILIASMATMLASGLWHGTGVTFIVWGLLHGLFISVPPLMNNLQQSRLNGRFPQSGKIMPSVKIVLTFFLISFSWIFFRANTLQDAFFIISNVFSAINPIVLKTTLLGQVADVLLLLTDKLSYAQVLTLPVFVFMAIGVEYLREKGDFLKNLSIQPLLIRWSLYIILVTSLILFGAHGFDKVSQFIYFRF